MRNCWLSCGHLASPHGSSPLPAGCGNAQGAACKPSHPLALNMCICCSDTWRLQLPSRRLASQEQPERHSTRATPMCCARVRGTPGRGCEGEQTGFRRAWPVPGRARRSGACCAGNAVPRRPAALALPSPLCSPQPRLCSPPSALPPASASARLVGAQVRQPDVGLGLLAVLVHPHALAVRPRVQHQLSPVACGTAVGLV